MRQKVFPVLLLGLAGLLASCGGGASTPNNASVGTYNFGGTAPGLAVIFSGTLNTVSSPDGQELRVKDAQGTVILRRRLLGRAGPITRDFLEPSIAIRSGSYTVEVDLPGARTFTKTVQVDASQLLPQPDSVSLTATRSTATISWSPVPGAQSYYAALGLVDDNGNWGGVVKGWLTTSTSMQFSLLNLTPNQAYRAVVFAYNADLTRQPTSVPNQFNASFQASSAFTVTSLGTLQLLDLPQRDGEGVDGGFPR